MAKYIPENRKHPKLLAESLEILGVTPEEVAAQPSIQSLIKGIGRRKKILDLIRLSDDPDARKICEAARMVAGEAHDTVPIEAYCAATGVPTKKALAIITGEAFAAFQLDGALKAALAHPRIVNKTIERALEEPTIVRDKDGQIEQVIEAPDGKADRKLMLQHAGFLPMAKGQTIIYGGQTVDARKQTAQVTILPSIEAAAKRMAERLEGMGRLPELLPAPRTDDILEGDPDPDEEGDEE